MKSFLPKTIKNPRGFTLIELMVVISIIAFLAVIGIAAFSNTQKTARDGRRRADIDAIAKAYESNFNPVAGTYVTLVDSHFASGKIPTDPVNSGAQVYTYRLMNDDKGFSVCVTLETVNNQGNASSLGNASTYPTFGVGNYFCKISQQSK